MHQDEEQSQIKSGHVKIKDKNTHSFGAEPTFKDRWAILCPARLLLFKDKPNTNLKQLALAVYPIINTDFKLKPANKSYRMTELSLSFSEQVIVKDSNPVAPIITKTFYISDPTEA